MNFSYDVDICSPNYSGNSSIVVYGELEEPSLDHGWVRRVSKGVISIDGKERDLYDFVAPGWNIFFGNSNYCNDEPSVKGAVVGRLSKLDPDKLCNFFNISNLYSMYHEFGHTQDFDEGVNQGFSFTKEYNRVRNPYSDASYEECFAVLQHEANAWEYAIDLNDELAVDFSPRSSVEHRAESSLCNYYSVLRDVMICRHNRLKRDEPCGFIGDFTRDYERLKEEKLR